MFLVLVFFFCFFGGGHVSLILTTSASDATAVSQHGGVPCADRGIVFGKMWDLQLEFKRSHVAVEPTGKVRVCL